MNEKLIFENYLLVLKSTVEVYVHGTLESTNPMVRDILKATLKEIMTSQANTYDIMKNNGWYNVQNVDNSIINSTLTKLENQN